MGSYNLLWTKIKMWTGDKIKPSLRDYVEKELDQYGKDICEAAEKLLLGKEEIDDSN